MLPVCLRAGLAALACAEGQKKQGIGGSGLCSGTMEPAAVRGKARGGSRMEPWKNSPVGSLPEPTAGTKDIGSFNTEQRVLHGGGPGW